MVRVQLHELLARGDRLGRVAVLVVRVRHLELRLLREPAVGKLRFELLVQLDRAFPVVVVQLLLRGLVELLGRPVLVLVLLAAEEAASGERDREEEGGQCRYTSSHGESRFEEREL
jgi:hypothetical protein